jgi:hypothetical protein
MGYTLQIRLTRSTKIRYVHIAPNSLLTFWLASLAWLELLTSVKNKCDHQVNLAAHLCGDICRSFLEGDTSFLEHLSSMGFNRVQINATSRNGVIIYENDGPKIKQTLLNMFQSFPNIEFIFQLNPETNWIFDLFGCESPANLVLLFDSSCGTGQSILESGTLTYHSHKLCGYAGGICVDNILDVLNLLQNNIVPAEKSFWIDMESSLREVTANNLIEMKNGNYKDVFSIRNCLSCIARVLKFLNETH